MPLLSQIFAGHDYVDTKPLQCTVIKTSEYAPFIRRCYSPKLTGLLVCGHHAKTVTYHNTKGERRTQSFNTVDQAEWFRLNRAADTWIETNYTIPKKKVTA